MLVREVARGWLIDQVGQVATRFAVGCAGMGEARFLELKRVRLRQRWEREAKAINCVRDEIEKLFTSREI